MEDLSRARVDPRLPRSEDAGDEPGGDALGDDDGLAVARSLTEHRDAVEADDDDQAEAYLRLLRPDEADQVAEAVEATYGDGPAPIPSDPAELELLMAAALLVPAVAESPDGELLVMVALGRRSRLDRVATLACGVTMEAAADRPYLYGAVFEHLVAQARRKEWWGLFSEVSGLHTERRRVNLALGAHETGYLPGWVSGRGERERRTTALFYLPLADAEESAAFVPPRYEDVVASTLTAAAPGPTLLTPPRHVRIEHHSTLSEQIEFDGPRAFVSVDEPGSDLGRCLAAAREELAAQGAAAVYADLPLDNEVTAVVGEQLPAAGFAYAGLFPNRRGVGLVLRLQALGSARISTVDGPTPSATGRHVVDFVLADLLATGHSFADPPVVVKGSGVSRERRLPSVRGLGG